MIGQEMLIASYIKEEPVLVESEIDLEDFELLKQGISREFNSSMRKVTLPASTINQHTKASGDATQKLELSNTW